MAAWRLIDHPAEAGVVARGRTRRGLFTVAARGMLAILTGGAVVRGATRRLRVQVSAASDDALLMAWLRALLDRFERQRLLARRWRFVTLRDGYLRAEVDAVRYDPRRQSLGAEIKAVTYHGLMVRRRRHGYEASVLFDV